MAHMVNAVNKVLRDSIPDITMPFVDDIPIKGCLEEAKDESIGLDGCRKFVANHISDCEKVLQSTFSGEKLAFGQSEILVVGHLCGPYGRKPSPAKVGHGSPTIPGSVRLLPHLDPTLRSPLRTALWVVEKGSEI